jgi:hypothetical protein
VCTREYATVPASKIRTTPAVGHDPATAVANANPDALCPDGNDVESGIST